MHDIRMIRDNPAAFDAALARLGVDAMSSEILAVDAARRAKITAAEEALAERNAASKDVGKAKAAGDEAEFERLRALVGAKKEEIARLEEEAKAEDERLTEILMGIPNLPLDDVPEGPDEEANVEVKRWGDPRNFSFDAKEHYEIGEAMGCMDFETAAKLSGSRFMVLSGALIRLHRALAQFMLDTHVDKNGLTETWTPVLVRPEMMLGTGQTIRNGRTTGFEFLRIEKRGEKIFYVARPAKAKSETSFELTSYKENNAVFENPTHDFPKKISYSREGEKMTAIVSAGEQGFTLGFKKVGCAG